MVSAINTGLSNDQLATLRDLNIAADVIASKAGDQGLSPTGAQTLFSAGRYQNEILHPQYYVKISLSPEAQKIALQYQQDSIALEQAGYAGVKGDEYVSLIDKVNKALNQWFNIVPSGTQPPQPISRSSEERIQNPYGSSRNIYTLQDTTHAYMSTNDLVKHPDAVPQYVINGQTAQSVYYSAVERMTNDFPTWRQDLADAVASGKVKNYSTPAGVTSSLSPEQIALATIQQNSARVAADKASASNQDEILNRFDEVLKILETNNSSLARGTTALINQAITSYRSTQRLPNTVG